MDCNCPQDATLKDIINETCGVNLKQIQRWSFQRRGQKFDPVTNPIEDLSSWQAFQTAADGTKLVVTPNIGGDPIIAPGEAITTGGGDNSTFNGIEEVEGTNPSKFTCIFKSPSSALEASLKALMCENDLVAFPILQGGRVAAKVGSQPDEWVGFPVESLFCSDRGNNGFGTKDFINFMFSLPSGWSEDLQILDSNDLNFNPLTQL